MARHKEANKRGSGGKLTEGDKLARDVFGSKGMWKTRRERGASVSPIPKQPEGPDESKELNHDEFVLLIHLAFNQKYKLPGDSLTTLGWVLIDDKSGNSDGIDENYVTSLIDSINKKRGSWINNILGSGVYLEPRYRDPIQVYLEKHT